MASRVCAEPGCPTLVEKGAYRGRCAKHRRERDTARGNRTSRGYGAAVMQTEFGEMTFDSCRRMYQALMNRGKNYLCACGCGEPVDPERWHLGHDQDDRGVLIGPERPECNLRDAGRASHR